MIREWKLSTDRRMDLTLDNGEVLAIVVDGLGKITIYSDSPRKLGAFLMDGEGYVLPVENFGYPYED